MASITSWHRLIPISRSSDFPTALATEVHDPMWMLARQHQMGELRGEDTGSPAFVRIGYKAAPLVDLVLTASPTSSTIVPLDPKKPFEAQILPEPFTDDLATQVELSLTFFQILTEAFPGTRAADIKAAFLAVQSQPQLPLQVPTADTFDPIDEGTSAFAAMTVGRALKGVEVYKLAKATPPTIPSEVASVLTGNEQQSLLNAYRAFVTWVEGTFGQIGAGDPKGWNPTQIDYDVKMRFGAGAGSVTVDVHPNENGSVDWTSFDLEATSNQPFTGVNISVAHEVPTHTRFPGMPAPRFWDFESGDIPWPDVDATRSEMAKLLLVDFAMLYSVDMFVVPLVLDVAKAVTIDTLVVYDVFGGRVVIDPVEAGRTGSNPDRFTLFTTAVPAATPAGTVTNFMCLPPGAGKALQHGPALEEVRFARDEVANMVWGIEAVTESLIGERRRGSERDAAVDEALPPPPLPATDAPLRYQVESKVPVNWIPFLIPQPAQAAQSTQLEKGATARAIAPQQPPVPVHAVGRILSPGGDATVPYRLNEEQVGRTGTRVERLVFGSRASDGKSYLWVARRRRVGGGETQSGLRFDAAQATET
jgi:hypothetical protein